MDVGAAPRRASRRNRRFAGWVPKTALTLMLGVLALLPAAAEQPEDGSTAITAVLREPNKMSYIAVPHPDDEMQAWSLIEDSPDNYQLQGLHCDDSWRANLVLLVSGS